jgi:ABC-type multidrug transport system fused ATPase/permease subunit
LGEVETFAMDPATLRECIATVSQYPLFIADTVRANFLLANEQATDAEIEAACRKTGLWPVIAAASPSDPLGMLMSRTPGQGFSGGELRLFAITRALLRRPKVLLLDEPTSGIDELGTESLARTLPGLLDGLTVIVIDHRPNFLKQIADEVCCLENGRFVDVGTPAELESRPSLFQRLRSAQETMAVSNMNVESVPLPVLRASSAPIAEVGAGLAKQAS